MKKILFLVNHSAQLKAPHKLIERLAQDSRYHPIVYLNFSGGWNLWKEVEFCRKMNFEFVCDEEGDRYLRSNNENAEAIVTPYFDAEKGNNNSISIKMKNVVVKWFKLAFTIRFILKKIKKASHFLESNQIDLVIVAEDAYDIHAIFCRAAKKCGIPTALIPFTKSNHLEILNVFPITPVGVMESFYCLFNRKWKFEFHGKKYLPLSLSNIIPLDLTHISPLQPFILMGGRSDLMLIENNDDKSYYSSAGIRPGKMRKVGAMYHDTFFDILTNYKERKAQFYKRHKIESDKPVMLCTLFPVATPVDATYGVYDYGTVANAIDFWLKPLLECDQYQLWIHHHPRTNVAFVRYIEQWNLRVIYEPIENVLPFCDLIISGVSATYRMALALGKPLLCYTENVFFDDFDKYPGTQTVKERSEYLQLIDRVKSDPQFVSSLAAASSQNIESFGPIDGSAYERIVAELNEILNQ